MLNVVLADERAEDMTMSLAPKFNLTLFPASFQSGENAEQITQMYDYFKKAAQTSNNIMVNSVHSSSHVGEGSIIDARQSKRYAK